MRPIEALLPQKVRDTRFCYRRHGEHYEVNGPDGAFMKRSRPRIGEGFLNAEVLMKHCDQVLGLLQKQIGNSEEVDDIRETARELWVNGSIR